MDHSHESMPINTTPTAPAQEDYTSYEARGDMFSVVSLLIHTAGAVLAAILVIILAVLMPWKGGMISTSFEISFILAVMGSTYALAQGYLQIRARGLGKLGTGMWYVAIIVSVLLAIDIILFGAALQGSIFTFPGSDILAAPDLFFVLILFQGIYFLSQSMLASATARSERNVRDWYTAIYFLILAINTAVIILGPIFISYF